tara:strand:- start:31 stop:1179 length:1149 start_codon:yes stop_codon:yes gene_type:complete
MEIVNKNIDTLIFAEYNPRQLTEEQYQQLKDSITRFGLVDPIIVNQHQDRKNIIVGGHQRTRVAKKLGIEEVPCVFVNLPYEKERELNVRLNKNTGGWDYDILADMFELDELIDWGFNEEELVGFDAEIEVEGNIDDDEIPEEVEPVCKLGDIWELGNHRLLCGDSTVKENIELLLDGNEAELLLTDPPYGINYGNQLVKGDEFKTKSNKYGWKNYGNPEWDKETPSKTTFEMLIQKTKYQIIWGGNYFTDYLKPSMGWLIWDKGQRGFSLADGEMAWTSFNNALRIKEYSRAKANKEDKSHPTQKPIDIIKWCLEYADRHSKNKPKKILDTFLGSGSTLIACEKTKRVCYGMELDPHYCDVIINRWEQYTGKKARLVNGTT